MVRTALAGIGFLVVYGGLEAFGLAQGRSGGQLAPVWLAPMLQLLLVVAVVAGLARHFRAREREQGTRLSEALEEGAGLRRANAALQESEEHYRLLADNTNEIILTTDRGGSISYASPSAGRMGIRSPEALVGRNILDLVDPASAEAFMAAQAAAYREPAEPAEQAWAEFRVAAADGELRWFEARTQALYDEAGKAHGAVSVLRSIEERKAFEEKLFAATVTDPLTHLTNRTAFIAMLQHIIDMEEDGCLALFDIDYFKSINIQHGHAAGDKVLITFTNLVRTLVRGDDIISRVGDERFGILFPRTTPDQAEAVCQRIVRTLADTATAIGAETLRITVSAGVSRISGGLDDTMKTAELALVAAKAKGRDRLEMATRARMPWASGQN